CLVLMYIVLFPLSPLTAKRHSCPLVRLLVTRVYSCLGFRSKQVSNSSIQGGPGEGCLELYISPSCCRFEHRCDRYFD
ncbi:hypothetical protein BD626DRAFT_517319, partial [Schizophyllum amplum]